LKLHSEAEIQEDLNVQVVSEGTIVERFNQVAKRVKPVNQAAKEELQATTGITHFDETGGDRKEALVAARGLQDPSDLPCRPSQSREQSSG
jgi:hypothetical protein